MPRGPMAGVTHRHLSKDESLRGDLPSAGVQGGAYRPLAHRQAADRIPAGSDVLRKQIEGGMPLDEIAASWRDHEQAFAQLRRAFLLY